MQTRILIAFCWVIVSSALEAQEPLPLAQDELLHRARVWEVRDRGDLARLALEKLAAARPGSTEALLELGELHLRLADIRAAEQVLSVLNQRFPGSEAARTFAIEYRFATRDRLQLASIRRLIQVGRETQARKELDRLFPEGAPGGMLSIEYYRILASTPSGWAPAYEGLKKLAAAHPGNPRYAIALARHLLREDKTAVEGAVALSALARRDDVRVREIDDVLSSVLRDSRHDLPRGIVDEYLSRNPEDEEVRNALSRRERALEEKALVAGNALARIDADLQERNLRRLNRTFTAASSPDPRAIEGRLLSALLAGQHPGAADMTDATALAAAWRISSQESLRAGNLELAAAQLHAAVAIRTERYEGVIPIASRLEALGESRLSAELLRAASRLDESSGWLFGTYVRWLIDNQRAEEALSLLERRPVGSRWTAQSRDTLKARALDQRSQSHDAAGRIQDAIADLEAAIALAPAEPWSRYRLAGLYARQGDPERGRAVLSEGVQRAAGDEAMRYVQSLYLASLDDYEGALAAIASIPWEDQDEGMIQLQARLRMELARTNARRLKAAGALSSARAALLDVEPVAQLGLEWARQLAFAWIELGDSQRAIALTNQYAHSAPTTDRALLTHAEVLDRAGETERLSSILDRLRALPLSREQQATTARLQRSLDLRRIQALLREGDFESAARLLDEMQARAPGNDRELRIARAELDLASGNPRAARDRLAALTSEQPDELDTRLIYVRALTESGEIELARTQLRMMQEQARPDDVDIQLRIAHRQLAVRDAAGADRTMQAILPIAPQRAEVWMLAGNAAQERRHYAAARNYFMQAQRAGDPSVATQARVAREAIDARLQSWAEAAVETREKPGEPGISDFSSITIPAAWVYANHDGRRFALRTDVLSIDAGSLSDSFDSAALFGTIQAAGPEAQRSHENEAQSGLSLAMEYSTDTLHVDLGTTPRNFQLPQVVGGIEWTPAVGRFDAGLGLSRRAVTGSVLSYGGMRDPISGAEWGGVVATGPYARLALYRERYGISATVTAAELTGTRVPDNRFFGARATADWRFLARDTVRAYLGLTLNRWHYESNLQNYTFGSGGYYSPQSYLSIAVPVELQGLSRGWSYRLRASLSRTSSRVDRAPFYPADPGLQSQAAASALPAGFDEPYFAAQNSSGVSMSAYAAAERQIARAFVLGLKADIDHADYYEPRTYMLYLRYVFGSPAARAAVPPRPVRVYGDY
jgi:cellulose synthase operon protein C